MSRSPIVRSDELRTANRRRVLVELRRRGACARDLLGEATNLSAAAISSFASELVADGVVETIRTAGARGRPRSTLQLRADAATMITVSLSIDRLHARLIDYHGQTRASLDRDLETRTLDSDALVQAVLDIIDGLTADPAAAGLRHVAVGFQGVVTQDTGELVWSPILKVTDVPLGAAIRARLGIDASVHNDCRLIAEALQFDKPPGSATNFATVLFSHGVGLALVLNDQPFSGTTTSALEFGHLCHVRDGAPCRCGRLGCIEAYSSDYGILRTIADARGDDERRSGRIPDEYIAAEIDAVRRGDPIPAAAFAEAGRAIGTGLAQLFLLFGPMAVALVGRTPEALQTMRPSIEGALRAAGPPDAEPAQVRIKAFPDDDGLLQRGLALTALAAVDLLLAEPDAHTRPAVAAARTS